MSFELFAEITRNNIVESRHFGAAVVCDAQGVVVQQWGDGAQLVFPRSALKPFYAIGFLKQVQECDASANCFPATQFEWQNASHAL
ncbi:MAG: asparaginase, partial [Alphaproteobacteria bacterium]|nr:asparaginase [Alphaproteobacteria bacterium]